MDLDFTGELWFWRGPAPYYFITVPDAEGLIIKDEWTFASYGWGMIPVTSRIGSTEWKTSLFPKDGSYVMPVKAAVRHAEQLDEGDAPVVHMAIRLP
jgi:hypothetical protein